jgi:hypothetical protein
MEEDTAPPRRNNTLLLGGMRATRNSSMRFTKPQGHMEEPPVRPRHSTRSSAPPPYAPRYSEGFVIMTEEEENKLARLERLVATSTSTTKLSTYWVFIRNTELVCNSPMECRQTPTRNSPRKFS